MALEWVNMHIKLTMPKNHKFVPKIMRKTQFFTYYGSIAKKRTRGRRRHAQEGGGAEKRTRGEDRDGGFMESLVDLWPSDNIKNKKE